MAGNLYMVATPIGNLDDITIRAIKVLNNVDIIAAEDTRHTLKLLNHLNIKKNLISYYKETEKIKAPILIDKLLEGKNIALVSDAGTPGISDPGEEIVKEAIENNIKIIPIPGPSAFINAMICSGLSTREFTFVGFLPGNNKEKKDKLEELKNENRTLIFYEAPHKMKNTLEIMLEILGDRKIVLARELTKIHENFYRGKISELISEFDEQKGEYIILLDLNDLNDAICNNICTDILYLVEPSLFRINKLITLDRDVFVKFNDERIVLNKSFFDNKDVKDFQFEAGIKVFYNIPPVNDRKDNSSIFMPMLEKMGLFKKSY